VLHGREADSWHAVEIRVVACDMRQAMIAHDGNDQRVIGQKAMLSAEIGRTRNLLTANIQNDDENREEIVHGFLLLAKTLNFGRMPSKPVGDASHRTSQ
jgi:hypothetical protein